ncbi:MAG TPA: zinc transporter ZupT [Clostridia bacterium]|jgi:ZIP family zinc transporter|nr:zinc transporter ZupT [Clostridia bacterium]HPA61599.1 zinc transporter ZupT [Clostridia bacterium]HQA97101.1 zinc transporter ZupT [Clostridia bacterium]HQO55964.1 zinc transporter ZupT [Clostridia bacterium]
MNTASDLLEAFLLTLLAGLSTGIGGAFVFFAKTIDRRLLCVSLGLSAGVMIYVSLVEILHESAAMLSEVYGDKTGMLYAMLSFFGGILLIAVIDKLIPCEENPHEMSCQVRPGAEDSRLKRTGLLTALTIAIHNFPEGMASFVSATQSMRLAIPIIVAIAIHNIPEGISIAMPIFYATGSRRIAMRYSLLAGLAEPLGALATYLVLLPFMSPVLQGVLFGVVAGIMVFISLDELLPSAQLYGEHHLSMYGLVLGMAVMALSLWLFV